MYISRKNECLELHGPLTLIEVYDACEWLSQLYSTAKGYTDDDLKGQYLTQINEALAIHRENLFDTLVNEQSGEERLFYFKTDAMGKPVALVFHNNELKIEGASNDHIEDLWKIATGLNAELLNKFREPLQKPKKKGLFGIFS